MANQSYKAPLDIKATPVNKKNITSSASPKTQKKPGMATRSAKEAESKVAKDTATAGMAKTVIGVGSGAGVVGTTGATQPTRRVTDASQLEQSLSSGAPFHNQLTDDFQQRSQSPEAAVPSTGVDAGRTFSQTMGPLHTSNRDTELQEYKLPFQEQTKLLENRTKELEEKDRMINKANAEYNELKMQLGVKDNRIQDLEYWQKNDKQMIGQLQSADTANMQERQQLQAEIGNRGAYIEEMREAFKHEQEKHEQTRGKAQLAEYNNADSIQKLKAERNELRSRLSKVASDMLTAGGNPDIADLSDPNRAMKLSERFSGIYDDDWTDAYETLTQKYKKDAKEAIQFLLSLLQECLEFCKQTSQSQMDALRNVFMHPCQSASQDVKAGKEKARIDSSGVKALMDLRRRISTTSAYEVKVQCMAHMKQQRKRSGEADLIAAASAYCDKCTDICWLMVLHDPPLHVALDVKPGTKMDPAHYSSYGGTGEVIDYLVWPPLYNGVGGGLLAKGTASPIPSASKKKPRK